MVPLKAHPVNFKKLKKNTRLADFVQEEQEDSESE